MCEPATLTAIGTWFAGSGTAAAAAGTVAANTAIGTSLGLGAASSAAAASAAAAAGATTAAAAGMTTAQMIALGMSAASTGLSALGMYNQGKAAEQTAANNARMAEYAAQDAQRRGEQDAAAVQRRGAALKSAQRVSLAARGLDLTYGTAADLQDQTDFFTASDVATTRDNARRDAWNMRARGQAQLAQGRADSLNSMLSATGTLIGGAGQVADKWYAYRKGI